MKKSLGILLVLLAIAVGIGFYQYNKPHKKMAALKADFHLEATELLQAFQTNETEANSKYLDKVIEIRGKVAKVTSDEDGRLSVLFESGSELSGVICQMDDIEKQGLKQINPGQSITLKGICTGMLMDVVLIRCITIA